jgi:hypothetical protein
MYFIGQRGLRGGCVAPGEMCVAYAETCTSVVGACARRPEYYAEWEFDARLRKLSSYEQAREEKKRTKKNAGGGMQACRRS